MSAPQEIEIEAPAKVNLGLRIVGLRADGYHELDGLFVPLGLGDRVRLEIRGGGREVTLSLEAATGVPGRVPAGARNLAARAALGFLERAGLEARVAIHLEKRIPSPGGLGGGSSDAAAVLRGLAALRPGALGAEALAELGLALGADVPFFLGPGGRGPEPAHVSGIGEHVAPQAGVPSLALALIHPGPALETAHVYAEFDARGALTGPGGAPTMPALQGLLAEDLPDADRWRSAEWLARLCTNDLEPAAQRLCPEIRTVRAALAASGALAVGLSGSGPTLFGIFPDAPAASRALEGEALRGLPGWAGVAETQASRGPG